MTAVAAPALLISKVLDTARELSARLFGTEWIQPPLPKPVMSAEAAVYPKLLKIYKELNRQRKPQITNNKGLLREKTEGRDSPLVFVKYNNFLMMNTPKYDIIDL